MDWMSSFKENFIDMKGFAFHYVEGPSSGPPLLLVHGLTGRWQNWTYLIPLLMEKWHLFACDLRGHGQSGHPPGGYLLSDYVQDTTSFINRQFTEPVVLVGHSLGAVVSLFTAAEVPAQVRAMLLLEPPLFNFHTPIQETPFLGYFSWVYELTRSSQSYDDLLKKIKQAVPDINETAARGMADGYYPLSPETAQAAVTDQIFAGCNLAEALQRVRCPVLFLQGERHLGAAMWDEDVEFVRLHCKQAQVQKIPGVGHGFDKFSETVLGFFQEFMQKNGRRNE